MCGWLCDSRQHLGSGLWHAVAGDGQHMLISTPWSDDDEKDCAIEAYVRCSQQSRVSASPSFLHKQCDQLSGTVVDDDLCRPQRIIGNVGLDDAPRAGWSTPPVPGGDVRFTQTVSFSSCVIGHSS